MEIAFWHKNWRFLPEIRGGSSAKLYLADAGRYLADGGRYLADGGRCLADAGGSGAGGGEHGYSAGSAIAFQNAGALVGGGSGGEYVVDEQDRAALDFAADGEGSLEVLQAFFPFQAGLGFCIAGPFQRRLAAQAGERGE